MPADQAWVLVTLVAALVLLITEWIPAGITGLAVIGSLLLGEAFLDDAPFLAPPFHSLVDKAVLAVGAMFVISAGIQRTGAVGLATELLMKDRTLSKERHYLALLFFVMVASAFMNNTPLVLIFMPVVLGIAARREEEPSRFLLPLSFISIMGGMCTLIGTSTNIIVAAQLERATDGAMRLGMFDFAPMGLIFAAVGATYLVLFRKKLLPDRPSMGLVGNEGLATEYMTEVPVTADSRYVGQAIGAAFPSGKGAPLRVLQLIREDVIQPALADVVLEADDVLLVKGDPAALVRARKPSESGSSFPEEGASEDQKRVALRLFEVVVTPGSRWVGRCVRDIGFGERFHVGVFAVQRHGTHLRAKLEELRLKAGDVLLVQGPPEAVRSLKASENVLVVEGVERGIPHTHRAPIAIAALILFMVPAVLFPGSVHSIALGAALVMILGRCLTAAEAYAAVNWDVLFLLGGMIALGRAFGDTGLAEQTGSAIVSVCGGYGATATIGALFCFTTLMTQLLSNNAAAAIMTPLAYETALGFPGAESPLPFVMAVAFGASCCFLTPIGYNTNLIVYGPGGYKFSDFMRIGLPLTILFAILATVFLPIIY